MPHRLNPTNPEEIVPPRETKPVVELIHDYLVTHDLDMQDFEVVDGALQAVWPEVYKLDKLASFVVTANVYIALATRYNFPVVPAYLHRAKMDGLI